jgi:ornithine carbamoyltransferase
MEALVDTKYFQQALTMFNPFLRVGDLTMKELSEILRRAQELKNADQRTLAEITTPR